MASIGTRKGTERAGPGMNLARSAKNESLTGGKLHPDLPGGAYMDYSGKGQPLLILATMAAVASGADATEHIAYLPGSNPPLHYTPVGAIAQAMKGPEANANGLRLDFDAANGDGANYVLGGLLGPFRHTVERTAGAVVPEGLFVRLRAVIEDVSGATEFAVGFRKAEAVQAAIDNYDEAAFLNVNAGTINTETILNGNATVTRPTGKTWADGEEHELMVAVGGNGKVRYWVDGSPVGIAFQFDDNEVVVPFIFALQGSDFAFLYTKRIQAGRWSHIGLD